MIKIYVEKRKGFEIKNLGAKVKGNHKHIYNIVFLLSDESKKDSNLNVYLTTEEGDHHVFSTWEILP